MLGLWIVATVLHRESWSTRLLEWSPLRYIGRLSYSIYLWHLLFLCTGEPDTHVTWAPLVFLGQRPLRYFAIFGLAMMSYYFIEKPCIRLGHPSRAACDSRACRPGCLFGCSNRVNGLIAADSELARR